jgi:hypothetical protein
MGAPCDVDPQKSLGRFSDQFDWGVTFLGEATRKAPVRAEPHPTSPRHPAMRREPPKIFGSIWSASFNGGDILGQGHAEAPARRSLTLRGASPCAEECGKRIA